MVLPDIHPHCSEVEESDSRDLHLKELVLEALSRGTMDIGTEPLLGNGSPNPVDTPER